MGLFGGGAKDQKRGARNAARELMKGIKEARRYQDPAYLAAIGRIAPTTAEMRNYLSQGNAAIKTAYNTARGNVANSLANQLAAIENARAQGTGYYQPYITAGQGGLDRIIQMTTPGQQFEIMQADPGYQWRLSQGLQGVTNSAGAMGGVFGGNTLKALNDYAQNQASNEFGNVYNRNFGLSQLGLGASQGAAGLSQWGGGAGAAANQWAGNQNADLARWLGTNRSNYYGNNAALTGSAADQRNQLELARAGMLADYAMQKGNSQAARESAQANMSGGGLGSSLLGLVGTLGGAALGNPYIGSAIGSGLSGLFGNTGSGGGAPAQGYGNLGYGYSSNNPWLTGYYG